MAENAGRMGEAMSEHDSWPKYEPVRWENAENDKALLVEALNGLLAHLWDGRKRDVKKDYSLMVAEVAARDAIAKAAADD